MGSEATSSPLVQVGAIMMLIMLTTASMMPPLPARIVPFWDDGACQWFNGTVVDKRIENDNGITADYIFVVNGTIDNSSEVELEVYGDALFFALIPIGSHEEREVCDTVELKEAIADGIIQFIS